MGVNAFLLLSLALASQFMLALADNDTVCTYEGQRFRLDRQGQLPLETYYNCNTEIECKEKCDAKSTCIIWQWQPTRRICWIMDVVPYPDRNSDFGINNCDNGKPTENAPLCVVTKGDRNNVWQDYRDMTKEDCQVECILDSDCLIWQHIRSKKLCRIHKLEIDLSKQSQVGIHYCSNHKISTITPTIPRTSTTTTSTTTTTANINEIISCGLNRMLGVNPACNSEDCSNTNFKNNHMCKDCNGPTNAAIHFSKMKTKPENLIAISYTEADIKWKKKFGKCVGMGKKIKVFGCKQADNTPVACSIHPYYNHLDHEECNIYTDQEKLEKVECKIRNEWLEVYPERGLVDCHKKTYNKFMCSDCEDTVKATEFFKRNLQLYMNKIDVYIYHATAENIEWILDIHRSDTSTTYSCLLKGIYTVYKCSRVAEDEVECSVFLDSENYQVCEYRHYRVKETKFETLKSIHCSNDNKKIQVYPDVECVPNEEFILKHWCKECKQDNIKANMHSNKFLSTYSKLKIYIQTVISPEKDSVVWKSGFNGFCIGRGKMFVFSCLLFMDNSNNNHYECDRDPNFPSQYQDCEVELKNDGHLERIECTTEPRNELQIYHYPWKIQKCEPLDIPPDP